MMHQHLLYFYNQLKSAVLMQFELLMPRACPVVSDAGGYKSRCQAIDRMPPARPVEPHDGAFSFRNPSLK
jgi:hypothetical protein